MGTWPSAARRSTTSSMGRGNRWLSSVTRCRRRERIHDRRRRQDHHPATSVPPARCSPRYVRQKQIEIVLNKYFNRSSIHVQLCSGSSGQIGHGCTPLTTCLSVIAGFSDYPGVCVDHRYCPGRPDSEETPASPLGVVMFALLSSCLCWDYPADCEL